MFYTKLQQAWQSQNSLLCVGLDPDQNRFPESVADKPESFFEFCRAIVDHTAASACAFKPQVAHFAAAGREQELARLISYIKAEYPRHVVILDAKRGDVGSTASFYAQEAYQRFQADAVTLSPYLGEESIAPFLEYVDRGVVILCRTSNSDSGWLQTTGAPPLFERVATRVTEWNERKQCMLVAGATYPEELKRIRDLVGDMPLLVPGIGAQGGSLQDVIKHGLDSQRRGLIISSSRGVIYASSDEDFAEAAGKAARKLSEEINNIIKMA